MPKRLPPGTIREETYKKSLERKLDKISYFIAMNGPSNKKRLERRLKIDKPTIYKAIHQLLETKRIVIHHHEMSGMVKYYDLTRLGLMHLVLYVYEEVGEDASKISDVVKKLFVRYPEWLPDIASLWPAIEKASIDEPEYLGMRPFTSLEALALYSLVGCICEKEVADAYQEKQFGIRRASPISDPASTLLLSHLNWILRERDEEPDDYELRWMLALQRNPILHEAAKQVIVEQANQLIAKANELQRQFTMPINLESALAEIRFQERPVR
jgi:hypothetical protein